MMVSPGLSAIDLPPLNSPSYFSLAVTSGDLPFLCSSVRSSLKEEYLLFCEVHSDIIALVRTLFNSLVGGCGHLLLEPLSSLDSAITSFEFTAAVSVLE